MSEEHIGRRHHDATVVLCHHVFYHRKVGGIVESYRVFAVVNVKIIGDHVLSENEAVLKSLSPAVSNYDVIVLVSRSNKSRCVARVFEKLFSVERITDLLVKAEVTVAYPNSGYIL